MFKNIITNLSKDYNFISTHNFLNKKYNNEENNCILTFDDGTLCHYKYVFPYLKKMILRGG